MKISAPPNFCRLALALTAGWFLAPDAVAQGSADGPTTSQSRATPLTPEEEKAADMRLPDIDRSGLLPELRKPRDVEPSERSPFGGIVRVFESSSGPSEASVAEQLGRLLRGQFRVSGFSESPRGPRVLIGPFAVGKGDRLPSLFANQVEQLVVKEITDRTVTFAFISNDKAETMPQDITVNFDLRPRVDSLLVGEAFRKVVPVDDEGTVALSPLESSAVDAVLKGAKEQDLRGWVDRPTELLNAPAVISSDDAEKR